MWENRDVDRAEAFAQYWIGLMYMTGAGVPRDAVHAVAWHRRAAQQGLDLAQHSLGIVYVGGYGVALDLVRAYGWFDLAAAQGHELAAQGREQAAKRMTPRQVSDARRQAREATDQPD